MHVKYRIIVFIFFCFLFSACKKDSPLFRVYGSITTINGGNAEIKAIVENKFGNCMTGAVVLVSDSKNTVTIMDYNSNSCCYTALVEAIEDDIYTITVDSIAIGKKIVITIPTFYRSLLNLQKELHSLPKLFLIIYKNQFITDISQLDKKN